VFTLPHLFSCHLPPPTGTKLPPTLPAGPVPPSCFPIKRKTWHFC
jgi:hypothetical protein